MMLDSNRSKRSHADTHLQAQDVAKKIGAKEYIECSARTGQGVRQVFEVATRHALVKPNAKGGKKGGFGKEGKSKCTIL